MSVTADRGAGAVISLFGLVLYFGVIPNFVEAVDDGWVLPATIPNAVAIVLIVCGILLILKPTTHRPQRMIEFQKAALYFGLLALGLLAMSYLGFIYTAPVIALVLMLLIGERRPLWLFLGVAVLPATIWFLVVYVLDRALP